MSAGKTVIVIREEDVAIRKKQAPPTRAQRDRTVYTRKEKHRRSHGERHEEAPGRQNPPGAFVSGEGRPWQPVEKIDSGSLFKKLAGKAQGKSQARSVFLIR